jgi:Mediator of RNA polymerase II transcription subunit 1
MTGTPTRVMASPRPGLTGAGPRPLAGKSPAVKTPASGHGHSHHLSSSSHPSSTPLAAPMMPDDLLALNSPAAALMASLNSHGLTSTPTGQDGLGTSTLQQAGSGAESATARNVEAERLDRLQGVADTLKTKLAGPGITREGVERLAQVNDLALLSDEDNVTIAGNHCVDLEITFDHLTRDLVKNVVLKINMSGEEEHKKVASEILKTDLTQPPREADDPPWKSLGNFATNLRYLSQLDHLSSKVNCFAAIAGLHSSFQTIWEEEKKRLTWRKSLQQLSHGAVGRPSMDRDGKLGLSIDYWVERQELYPSVFCEHEEIPASTEPADCPSLSHSPWWRARISCETGSPSITKFRDWLAPEILTSYEVGSRSHSDEKKSFEPAWRDPIAVDSMTDTKEDQDAMMENLETILEPSNVRFVSYLDPPVVLPLSTILSLTAQSPIVEVDQSKVITYQEQLEKMNGMGRADADNRSAPQWPRELTIIDNDGGAKQHRHLYSIHSLVTLWCYAVDKLVFSHPRQVAGALPTLRQYALLWTLLRKLVPSENLMTTASGPGGIKSLEKSTTTRTRSNMLQKNTVRSRQAKLNELLSKRQPSYLDDALPVTVQLDIVTDSSVPTIHLIVPLGRAPWFGKISVGIGLNGSLQVSSTLPEFSDGKISRKMAKILALSEDLGVLVEWLLEKVQVGPK